MIGNVGNVGKTLEKKITGRWRNFCEQKFPQTPSKNFIWVARRERRTTQTLIEEHALSNKSLSHFMRKNQKFIREAEKEPTHPLVPFLEGIQKDPMDILLKTQKILALSDRMSYPL